MIRGLETCSAPWYSRGDWAASPGPRYSMLADALTAAIRAGALVRGDLLPSERLFAAALSLSRSTVAAVYDELRGRGLVTSRRSSATMVAAAPGAADARTGG